MCPPAQALKGGRARGRVGTECARGAGERNGRARGAGGTERARTRRGGNGAGAHEARPYEEPKNFRMRRRDPAGSRRRNGSPKPTSASRGWRQVSDALHDAKR